MYIYICSNRRLDNHLCIHCYVLYNLNCFKQLTIYVCLYISMCFRKLLIYHDLHRLCSAAQESSWNGKRQLRTQQGGLAWGCDSGSRLKLGLHRQRANRGVLGRGCADRIRECDRGPSKHRQSCEPGSDSQLSIHLLYIIYTHICLYALQV